MAFIDALKNTRDLFFKEKNPKAAEKMLQPWLKRAPDDTQQRLVYELMGLILREQRKYKDAMRLYEKYQDHYQAGYCALLLTNWDRVQHHWGKVLGTRENHWCLSLYGLTTRQLQSYPTLFQIRNHIECDITNLVMANQLEALDNLLSYVDFLTQINLESPKFAGRALLHAGLLNRAGEFLMQGQKALPNDPEIYFHLAQYCMALSHESEATLMLKQCLLISPTYTPATKLLTVLEKGAA